MAEQKLKRVLPLPQPGFFSKKTVHRSHWPVFFPLIYMYVKSPFLLRIAHWNIYYSPPRSLAISLCVQGAGWPSSSLTQSCLECSKKRLLFPGQWNSPKVRAALSLVTCILASLTAIFSVYFWMACTGFVTCGAQLTWWRRKNANILKHWIKQIN